MIVGLIQADELLAALILLYSAIDGCAWLAGLAGNNAEDGVQFKAYVQSYVLRGRERVTDEDVWAARCGILHTQTPESRLSRKQRARELVYDLRIGRGLTQPSRPAQNTPPLSVNPIGILLKWKNGWKRFAADLRRDPTRHADFVGRAESLMDAVNTPRIPHLIKRRLKISIKDSETKS